MTRAISGFLLGALSIAASTASIGCKPAAVDTADRWLKAYAAAEVEPMIELTDPPDRALLRQALGERLRGPGGALAAALPPRPLGHEILALESKDPERGRFVVFAALTLPNPLPAATRRHGQEVEPMPEVRSLRRRFLVVGRDRALAVKLDLARVVARAELVLRFEGLVRAAELDAAKELASEVPPPPDDGNGTRIEDRLVEALQRALAADSAEVAEEPTQ